MTNEERIAREAYSAEGLSDALFNPAIWKLDDVILRAARLGIEHGERESAAKIADMKATLEHYAGTWGEPQNNAAAACLARNFPAPKPSLREAAQAARDDIMRSSWEPETLKRAILLVLDALAREEGKP